MEWYGNNELQNKSNNNIYQTELNVFNYGFQLSKFL